MSNQENETETKSKYVKIFNSEQIYIIDDLDFISLMKSFFTRLSTLDIYDGFEWNKLTSGSIYFSNLKINRKNLANPPEREDESDYMQWFVDNEIIPEGNYLLLITV